MMSADLEDVAALMDGCIPLEAAVAEAGDPVQAFVVDWCARLMADAALLATMEAHLPRAGDFTRRRERLRERLRRLAGSALAP